MNTGVQRVVRALHRALSALVPVTPLIWDPALASYCTLSRRERGFLEHPFAGRAADDAEPGRRANRVPLWSRFVRTVSHRRNRLDLPARLTAADTLFVPEIFQDNRVAFFGGLPTRTPARLVGMYYDALTLTRPDIMPSARRAGFADYLRALGGFHALVTISQESAADLRAVWREGGRPDERQPPVAVFHLPVDHDGAPRPPVTPAAAGVGRRTVLCVATFEPRKNHLLLLDAAERTWAAGADWELVLVGRTTAGWGERVVARVEEMRRAGRPVRWRRHVDDATLRRAYEGCAFTVFPSLAEGFGIPIVESVWHGRPCVCGSNGAIGEAAAGGGCLAVDQTDPAALAAGIRTLLDDAALYRRLCEEAAGRTFGTWEGLARELSPILGKEA